ncbi:PREDICTED: uncharacterized protein LOC109477982 [Branchiostoma belcheri]|uniref:Uncharacterized protein LOC109477982 n=1 Tax=Branchiostoma belcheri TaxID=7741 RepID=A0A6P4ZE67_BRABE|nr:PREDICTED: uncharacterized protein LOC109477982 [Branchiostoma belcheri]
MADFFSQVLVAHSVLLFSFLQVLFDWFLPDDVDRSDVRLLPAEFGLSLGLVLIGVIVLYCRHRKIKTTHPTNSRAAVYAVGISFTEPLTKETFVHFSEAETRTVLIPSVIFPCHDTYNSPGGATAFDSTGYNGKKSSSKITRL